MTITSESPKVFEDHTRTPVIDSKEYLSVGPVEFRDSGIKPLHVSDFSGSRQFREEFIRGAEALGLNTARKPLRPQQFVLADALNACRDSGLPKFSVMGICWPRRASKTTSIFAVMLGRCLSREDYQTAYAAQSGTKARERFLKDLVVPLERMFPNEDSRPFKINRSRGGEHIRFNNGSLLTILPPQPESFRGDAYDLVVLDESQEHDPELSEELLGAVLPTFDTRPGAQLVVAGTTGEHRSGLLWDTLEDGRNDRGNTGIVEYAAPDTTPGWAEGEPIEGTVADPAIWMLSHPGIDTLTTLEAISRNFDKLSLASFSREYLGIWPAGASSSFINMVNWDLCALAGDLPAPPPHFALAIQAHPDQVAASVVAVWRDAAGLAHLLVLDHRSGVRWLASRALELSRKYRVPIVYDSLPGATSVEVEQLNRARPRPRLEPQTTRNIANAAALLIKEVDGANVRHYGQEMLTEAARITVKRRIGINGGWGLGRNPSSPGDDITPLEAAAMGLRAYDDAKPKVPLMPSMGT